MFGSVCDFVFRLDSGASGIVPRLRRNRSPNFFFFYVCMYNTYILALLFRDQCTYIHASQLSTYVPHFVSAVIRRAFASQSARLETPAALTRSAFVCIWKAAALTNPFSLVPAAVSAPTAAHHERNDWLPRRQPDTGDGPACILHEPHLPIEFAPRPAPRPAKVG
jgi:hypothetical protein